MNTIECIKTRRSIREYNGQPVDRKLIEQAIEAAAFSPSWKNTQVTRYSRSKPLRSCVRGPSDPARAPVLYVKRPLFVTSAVSTHVGYPVDLLFDLTKRKANSRAGRRNMLKGSSRRKAGRLL